MPTKPKPATKRAYGGRAPASKPAKCAECGSAGKHKTDCPNYACPECKGMPNTTGHAASCSKFASANGKLSPAKRKRGTVDGKDAVIDHTHRELAKADAPQKKRGFPKIAVINGALEALQSQIDDGDFSGDQQQKNLCQFEYVEDGADMVCGHVSVLPKVVKKICPTCKHAHKETIERFCLGHSIAVWGGGDTSRLQMELVPT